MENRPVLPFVMLVALAYGLTTEILWASPGSPLKKRIDSARLIQNWVDDAQKQGRLPAIGVLVEKNGKSLYLNAQGKRSLQHTTPVTSRDLWHLGSNTKAMTALLIALAVQDGRLSYRSRLTEFQDRTTEIHPLNTDLTITDLLSHGSGLHDMHEVQGGALWSKAFRSNEPLVSQRIEMAHAALKETPHLDPRDSKRPLRTYRYANINYLILGSVLENIYGMDWESLLRKKVFAPLQMSSCGFGVAGSPEETEPSQPWPHRTQGAQLVAIPPKDKPDNPSLTGPAGTVHCSLADWKKFISELVLIWKGKGALLKSPAIATTYFSFAEHHEYTNGGWGRSGDKFKTPVFFHNGSNTLNFASVLFSPKKNIIILVTANSGQLEAEEAILALRRKISEHLLSPLKVHP